MVDDEFQRDHNRKVEDLHEALKIALLHSGSGEQRDRWEKMIASLEEAQSDMRRRQAEHDKIRADS
jgi:hypothetical protein